MAELVQTKKAKEAVMLELEQLSNYNAELHKNCDFVMKNFALRQTARDEEVEALRQAKAILSGAKFEEFLQMSATSAPKASHAISTVKNVPKTTVPKKIS